MVSMPTLSFLLRNSETARMSLIHEALQKAEAERRAGELPPLVSATPMRRSPEASSRKTLWVMIGLAVLAAAAYTNRALIMPAGNERAAASAADAVAETAPREPAIEPAPAEPVARKPLALRQPPPAAPATDAFTAAQTDAIAAKLGAGRHAEPELQEAPEVSESAASVPVIPVPVPLPIAESNAPDDTLAEAAQAEMPEPSALPPPVPKESGRPVTSVTAPPPSQALVSSSSPNVSNAVPMLFELPLATRQALPPLKVTMQVYHQDPTLRFAIIDGKRVNEQGVVGNELNLIEIERDALLLEYRGTRFLLPRLGR